MRKGDYCIRNIDKLVDEGCISPKRAKELEKWQMFRGEHSEISDLSEGACKPLMREKDLGVQAKAIEKIENALNLKKPVTASQSVRVIENLEAGRDNRGRPLEPSGDTEKAEIEGNIETPVEDFVDPDIDDVGGMQDIPDMPEAEVVEAREEEEEERKEERIEYPEITASVTREFLTNAGHVQGPPREMRVPTEEDKQAIFDKCIQQAFKWGMNGDEIARRMKTAIMFVFPSGLRDED